MILTKEEFMTAARIEEDDPYTDILIHEALVFCMGVARADTEEEYDALPKAKLAMLRAAIEMNEHRGDCDYRKLALVIRAILMGDRKAEF